MKLLIFKSIQYFCERFRFFFSFLVINLQIAVKTKNIFDKIHFFKKII